MTLSHRERRLLNEIDASLSASDPKLAAMMGIFSRLAAGERLPGQLRRWDQPVAHMRVAAAMAVALIAALLSYAILASGGRARGTVLPFAVTCTTGCCTPAPGRPWQPGLSQCERVARDPHRVPGSRTATGSLPRAARARSPAG